MVIRLLSKQAAARKAREETARRTAMYNRVHEDSRTVSTSRFPAAVGLRKKSIENGLLIADVAHARTRPKRNAFHYGVYYLSIGLDDLAQLKKLALLSLNRWNMFSFFERNYGKRDGSSLEPWIRNLLTEWNIPQADGKIVLVSMPRLFGYAFNPVSFWFCLDKEGTLRAVLSEVSNTFGQHHSYLSFREDRLPIETDDILRSEKIFYVSPFIEVRGHYLFRFHYRSDKIGVWIDYYDADGLMLTTSLTGKRIPLTSGNLLHYFFRYPLVTLKVIGLIHYQALRLSLKGIHYLTRPTPPAQEVSR